MKNFLNNLFPYVISTKIAYSGVLSNLTPPQRENALNSILNNLIVIIRSRYALTVILYRRGFLFAK
jgi:hypothetical protein